MLNQLAIHDANQCINYILSAARVLIEQLRGQ